MDPRVVITGMGTINPVGKSVPETWEKILKGVSATGPITLFDTSDLSVQIACEVQGFDPAEHMEGKEVRRTDRFQQFALVAFREAWNQARLDDVEINKARMAVLIASAVGGLNAIEESVTTLIQQGPRKISPFTIPMIMSNGAAGLIAIERGIRGPCFSINSACASALDAIGQALLMIRAGIIDAAITGGSEATITRLGIGTFARLGALSRKNESYRSTPSPFDRDRDGFVMGEGAAILVLERLDHAQARGVEILAELIGYGSTVDAFHLTAPSEDGLGAALAMEAALQMAELEPRQVDYINAHGTGTQLNDVSETRALKRVFSENAYHIPISSTKSMTGHMMGTTGALESIFCIMAIRQGLLPPTVHLENPDPECDLDYVPNRAREASVEVAINNAFGFGGQNTVLAFRAFSS